MAGIFINAGQRWSCGPAFGIGFGFNNAIGMAGIFINAGQRWSCGPALGLTFEVFTPLGLRWQAFSAGQLGSCGPALGELLGFLYRHGYGRHLLLLGSAGDVDLLWDCF
jgi:hypothetical protein